MAAANLRPNILRVMTDHQGRPLSTGEIYDLVAETGVPGFDPQAKRDRNLVNRELSDLAGMSPHSHSKATPQVLTRVGRGRYIYREPELPMDEALVREVLELVEVYEKRPPRRRGTAATHSGPSQPGVEGEERPRAPWVGALKSRRFPKGEW